jgi:tRNA A37 methylthiotransferase MiaB
VAGRRLEAVRALVAAKARAFRGGLLGRTATVLVEETAADGAAHGLSEHYVRVHFAAPRDLSGRFALVKLDGFHKDDLRGTLLEALP